MKIAIGSDHAGAVTKSDIAEYLQSQGHEVEILGAKTADDSYDYPMAADLVAHEIHCNRAEVGILVCGSGIGVSIRANRFNFIRAALCTNAETAKLARLHNHANVLCLGERTTPKGDILGIVDAFLNQDIDRNERHIRRVEQLQAALELPPC